ncbi:MAG: HAD-IC family P-type ATPase [Ferruginibacter sp.]
MRKEVFISYDPSVISLRKVVELLSFIGYEPNISLNDVTANKAAGNKINKTVSFNRKQIYRIGVAGFCFANIMMLSFPEYFSSGHIEEKGLKETFTWLNLFLSIPVLLFSASGLFISAWKGIRQRFINIDVPIALAIIVTFARSYYEIISGHGAGYLDSGTGIVFFMLIGRWFQDKTFDSLSFDRDYRSYFPLGVTIIIDCVEKNIPVTKLKKGDHIIIRNEEMIPADAVLLKGDANIDYSFVSGENAPVKKYIDELIYAGGKQAGNAIELEVMNAVSQSYITELWNNDVFNVPKNRKQSFIHPWSRYFTLVLFSIAFLTTICWWIIDPSNILPALTAVLIVACPCSLLLSATFTFGNMLRIFGKNKLYLKNASVIEAMASIDCIVFDKTGTITKPNGSVLEYAGVPLSEKEKTVLQHISSQSKHPLSKAIASSLHTQPGWEPLIQGFREYPGKGIAAMADNIPVKMGSAVFIGETGHELLNDDTGTQVHIQIGNALKGRFSISNHYRKGIRKEISALKRSGYDMHVLSGDNDSEKENLHYIFGGGTNLKFRQSPAEKLAYIKQLQASNKKVMMIGDGLNDSGALMQAEVGIAVNDNTMQFTPACDAILDGDHVNSIDKLLRYAKAGKNIVRASFIISILYNIAGLSFAVTANLSPIVAAILMPVSSISIVLFVSITSSLKARHYGL